MDRPRGQGGNDMSWKAEKLQNLAEIEGLEVMELLEQDTYDSVCKGICTEADCDYTCEVEPDQDRGYCEVCGKNSVMSSLMLAGIL
jgi:hypothetical protein